MRSRHRTGDTRHSEPADVATLHGLPAALAATTGAQSLATLAVFVLPVLAPHVARDLGVAPHLVGYQVALIYMAAAAASMMSGGVLARGGPARSTQIALAAGGLGCAAISLGGISGAALGSVLLGLGYGLTNPAATQVLNRLAPPARRNLVFSVKQMGVPIGAALAGLILPSLGLALGWRGAAAMVAVALVLAALGLGVFHQAWDRTHDPDCAAPRPVASRLGTMAVLRTRPGLMALATTGALFSAVQLSLGAYAVTMLVDEFKWGVVAAGAAAAAIQASGALARLAWAAVADRRGAGLPVLAAIGLCTAAAALTVPLAPGWPSAAVLILLCAFGSCSAGWTGVAMAEAARLAPAGAAGTSAGGVLAVTYAGIVVGPPVFAGAVAMLGSYAGAFAALAILPLLGAVTAWRAHHRAPAPS
ncbi:MAG TPA: MFS transporter [Roseomonas sp.]|jgi:MFS family permease